MDRTASIQTIVLVVLVMSALHWMPVETKGRQRHPLGWSEPHAALAIDQQLLKWFDHPDGEVVSRASMRALRRSQQEAFFQRWQRLLSRVESIREGADEDTFVQFKGVPRNELYLLVYDLYPIPCQGKTYEEGSRPEDPTVPGATVIEANVTAFDDMTREEYIEWNKRQLKRRKDS